MKKNNFKKLNLFLPQDLLNQFGMYPQQLFAQLGTSLCFQQGGQNKLEFD